MLAELKQQLKAEEGVKPCVYKDSLGVWTIGVGRLVDPSKPGAGLRPEEIDFLLANDIEDRINALQKAYPWFQNLDDERKAVLVQMAFQLGMGGLAGFKNMLAAVEGERWDEAAADMLDSTWAKQTPARAKRLAEQMRQGVYQFP